MITATLLIAGALAAPCPAGDLRRAKLVRVLDGDTVDVTLDQGLGETRAEWIRLIGIDTPELHAKDAAERAAAVKAKAYTQSQLGSGSGFTACISKRDDFGRVLATIMVGGLSLNQALLEGGLARPFKK